MKKHNFYAGPSILSQYTIKNTAEAIINFAGTGLSVLEVSHRSPEFVAVIEEARALVKELLQVPDGYSVLFLGGGASMQFAQVPFNQESRLSRHRHMGLKRHQGSTPFRRGGCSCIFQGSQLHIHSQGLYRTHRRRLFPLHIQQYYLRHRDAL